MMDSAPAILQALPAVEFLIVSAVGTGALFILYQLWHLEAVDR